VLAALVVLWFCLRHLHGETQARSAWCVPLAKETARHRGRPSLPVFRGPLPSTPISFSVEQIRRIEVGFRAGLRVYEEAPNAHWR